jgi:hypothetical protein
LSSEKKYFKTARTQRLREAELSAADARTISDIEEFGCSVVNVAASRAGLGWAYTIGIFDTCGSPELITVGLPPEVADFALTAAAKWMRAGSDLTKRRHRELVGRVECEFRAVDQRWPEHLMDWAVWYYNRADFPVLQLVYPDGEGRFPEDKDFDTEYAQPLMQPASPMTKIENDFWASADPKSSLFDWKFPDPPHTGVYLSQAVHSGLEPVTYVSHDVEDGAWQFLGDSRAGDGGPALSCFHHAIDRDPSLAELADLPAGWCAQRAGARQPWVRSKHASDSEAS